jgi:hypothetical protein
LRHLYIKTNILPRQARDKHRENSKKGLPFFPSQHGVGAHAGSEWRDLYLNRR